MLLKRIAAFLLALLLIFSPMCMRTAYAAGNPATPTDLYEEIVEFEDDDFGYIDRAFIERKVFLDWLVKPQHYGDEVTLIAILIDFLPTDVYTFTWEYSLDCEEWFEIEDEHEQTYSFIFEPYIRDYYFRVVVHLTE